MQLKELGVIIPTEPHSNIAAAVSAAQQSPGAAVWIPAWYTGGDSVPANPGVPVYDNRGTAGTFTGASSASSPNIKLVQTPGNITTFSAVTSSSKAFLANNIAGNLLLTFVAMSLASSSNTVAISDSQGNTWIQAGQSDVGQYYVFYVASAKAGVNAVTATFNASSSGTFTIAEYSGVLAAHPVETTNTPNGSGATFSLGSGVLTPVSGSLMVVWGGNNGGPNTYNSFVGCTPRTGLVNVAAVLCDNTSTVAGQNFYVANQNGTAGGVDFIAKVVTFLPATYVPPAYPALVRGTEGAIGTVTIVSTGTSPIKDVFAGGNQAGNTILVEVQQAGAVDNITSVTDSAGNIYARLPGGGDIADSNNHRFYSLYAAPVTANSLTNNTVSVAFSAGTLWMAAVEVSGITGVEDVNSTGALVATKNNDFVITSNGFSGGGVTWTNLSGFDIFGTPFSNNQMEVNYFLSCSQNNAISAFINNGTNFPASFSVGLLASNPTAGCPGASGSLTGNFNPSVPLVAVGTGTCSPSATLGLYPLGQTTGTPCTSTTLTQGLLLKQSQVVLGISVTAGTAGVNASSGVVTVKNGASATAITCTIGTNNICQDFSHPTPFSATSSVVVQVTTQAAETLANLTVTLYLAPVGAFPLGVL